MSVNKVILIGNVGRDPEIRYLDNNNRVANFSIATTERGYKLANGTEVPERTEWHNIVAFRGLAEIIEKYVKKGTPVYIEGKIRTSSYDDKSGIKRYRTEIYTDNLQLLGSRRDENAPAPMAAPAAYAPAPAPAAHVAEPAIKAESFDNNPFGSAAPSDDSDLPF